MFRGKLFVYYGEYLESVGIDVLREHIVEGYECLPLDTLGVALTSQVTRDFHTPTSVFDRQDLATRGYNLTVEWFREAYDEFSSAGICWAEHEMIRLRNFWFEISAAQMLCDMVRMRDKFSIRIAKARVSRIKDDKAPSDMFAEYLKHQLHEVVEFVLFDPKGRVKPLSRLKPYRKLPEKIIKKLRNKLSSDEWFAHGNFNRARGGVLIAVLSGESFRYQPVLMELKNASRWPVSIVTIDERTHSTGGNLCSEDRNEWVRRNQEAVARLTVGEKQNLIQIIRALPQQFSYLVESRWPALQLAYNFWKEELSKNRPRVILTSSHEVSEAIIPVLVAKELGIPTISLMHSAIFFTNRMLTDYALFETNWVRDRYSIIEGFDQSKIIPCAGVVSEEGYFAKKYQTFTEVDVLFLIGPRAYYHNLAQSQNMGGECAMEYLAVYERLYNLLSDLRLEYEVRVKLHPRFNDKEILDSVGDQWADFCAPKDAELGHLLNSVKLVVFYNYFGSAIVNVLRRHKPVINFTESGYDFMGEKTGIESIDDLKNEILETLNNSEKESLVMRKSETLYEKHFAPVTTNRIMDVLTPFMT